MFEIKLNFNYKRPMNYNGYGILVVQNNNNNNKNFKKIQLK